MGILLFDIGQLYDIFTGQPVLCGIVINVFQDISSHSIPPVLSNRNVWIQFCFRVYFLTQQPLDGMEILSAPCQVNGG